MRRSASLDAIAEHVFEESEDPCPEQPKPQVLRLIGGLSLLQDYQKATGVAICEGQVCFCELRDDEGFRITRSEAGNNWEPFDPPSEAEVRQSLEKIMEMVEAEGEE